MFLLLVEVIGIPSLVLIAVGIGFLRVNSGQTWSRLDDQIVPTVFWSFVSGVVALFAAFAAFHPPSVVSDFGTQVEERMLFIMGFAALISVATAIGLWFHYGAKRP